MLLLRAVLGIATVVQGAFYMAGANPTASSWFVGLAAVAAGGSLLFGFLTPIVGAVVAVIAAGVALSLLPNCTPNVFDSKSAFIFASTILVGLIGLGPGRFSIDARVFGRREIIIPPRATQ